MLCGLLNSLAKRYLARQFSEMPTNDIRSLARDYCLSLDAENKTPSTIADYRSAIERSGALTLPCSYNSSPLPAPARGSDAAAPALSDLEPSRPAARP